MIDKKDIKILNELKQNGRMSAQEISKKTGIPVTTVFNRVKRMEKSSVIKKYSVVLDEGKTGRNIAAYVLITVDYNLLKKKHISQHELASKLRKYDFVEEVSMITGVTDIILRIRVSNISELNEFVTKYLRNVDGIERTQTAVILENF